MNTFKKIISNYKHAWPLLYILIYLPWFAYLEKTVVWHFSIIHMKIDDLIPFNEYFIIPYMLWFLYVAGTVIYFFFKDVDNYYKLLGFLFIGMTIFLIVSTLYPNGQYLRPTTFDNDNICTRIVQWLYATDTSTNLFPSIHVYNSIGTHIAICRGQTTKDNKYIKSASFVLMTLIILSTMFLKQHSVFDVITAFALSIVSYRFIYTGGYENFKNRIILYNMISLQKNKKNQVKEPTI